MRGDLDGELQPLVRALHLHQHVAFAEAEIAHGAGGEVEILDPPSGRGALLQVSLPAALEDFLRQRWPAAERLAFCHAGARGVLRRGWAPLSDDCMPEPGDEVFALE